MKRVLPFLLLSLTAQAQDLSVWGEALYWKPSYAGVNFANVDSGNTNQNSPLVFKLRSLSIRPDFDWGFRLGASYGLGCECFDFRLSGLYLRSSHHSAVRIDSPSIIKLNLIFQLNQFAVGPVGFGLLSNRLSDQYWNIRTNGGQTFFPTQSLSLRLSLGGRFVNLERRVHSLAETNNVLASGRGNLKLNYFGIGPETGLDLEWCRYSYFHVVSRLAFSALVGRTENQLISVTFITSRYEQKPATIITPGLDFEVGVGTKFWSRCQIEVGYAMHHYWNLFQDRTIAASAYAFSSPISTDTGFAGPYLNFGVTF